MRGNETRTEEIRKVLIREELDALAVRIPENVLFLSGYWPMIGMSLLVFPAEERPVCVIPDCYREESTVELWEAQPEFYNYGLAASPDPFSAMARILSREFGSRNWKRIGMEESCGSRAVSWNSAEFIVSHRSFLHLFHDAFPGAELIDAVPLLEGKKSSKNPYETEKIRTANEISCLGLEVFEDAVIPGSTGARIAAAVEHRIMAEGTGRARRVRAYAQVATGPAETSVGYRPNEISTTRKIVEGDLVLLELGVVADGYWADRTRVRVAGTPDQQQRDIFHLVMESQEAALKEIRPGAIAGNVDAAARRVIESAGYGEAFPHITGHGVGFSYHETCPAIHPDNSRSLEKGMIHSVEPGIYIPAMGGIRLEDDVLVTETGCEILGPWRRELS